MDVPPLSKRLHPEMAPSLTRFNLAGLEGESHTIYGLLEDLRIGYLNPAWYRFARQNAGESAIDAWGVGKPVLEAMSPDLAPRFEQFFRRMQDATAPAERRYLCPSPTVQRVFVMRVLPLENRRLLVHNALVVQEPHQHDGRPFGTEYLNDNGFIVQCSNCRRIRHGRDPDRWDWVPSLLTAAPAPVSHGLCQPCLGFYFPPDLERDD